MLDAGTRVRIRKDALALQDADFRARVDELRVAVVEKGDKCHGWVFLVFPKIGRKREFRAGWFDPRSLEIV